MFLGKKYFLIRKLRKESDFESFFFLPSEIDGKMFVKNQKSLKTRFQKSISLDRLTDLKQHNWQFRVVLEGLILREMFLGNTFADSKTSIRIRFWINFFTTRQVLNRKLYKKTSFGTKILIRSLKVVGKSAVRKSVSSVNLSHKNVKNGVSVVFWKVLTWE